MNKTHLFCYPKISRKFLFLVAKTSLKGQVGWWFQSFKNIEKILFHLTFLILPFFFKSDQKEIFLYLVFPIVDFICHSIDIRWILIDFNGMQFWALDVKKKKVIVKQSRKFRLKKLFFHSQIENKETFSLVSKVRNKKDFSFYQWWNYLLLLRFSFKQEKKVETFISQEPC